MNLRTQMEYRFQFWFFLATKAVSYLSGYLMIWLILYRFRGVGSWSVPEVLVLWALVQLCYTLSAPFFYHSMGRLNEWVVSGQFDHYLAQPVHPLINLVARNCSWTYTSQIVLNAGVLFYALHASGLSWAPGKIAFLLLTILGGFSFQSFTFLIGGAACLRWLNASNLGDYLRWLADITQYPISIFPQGLRVFITYVVPAALANYYPALYLLGKADSPLATRMAIAGPLVCVGLGLLGLALWWKALDFYQSSGS